MSDVKLHQKAALALGAADLVYASRPDGSADGKATLAAVAALVHGVNGPRYAPAFRGALVRKAADETGADYSAAPAIAWDAQAYDTDGFHSVVSNSSRLTVPAGVSYVRLTGALRLANVTAAVPVSMSLQKNGSPAYDGSTTQQSQVSGDTPALQACSPVLAVAAGDYFEMSLGCADTAIDIAATGSYFAIEVVG